MGHNRMEWLLMAMNLFAFIFFFQGEGICMHDFYVVDFHCVALRRLRRG